MRTGLIKYFTRFTTILILIWIISCSGKSGTSTSVNLMEKAPGEESAGPSKLINILSPEENASLRLNEPVKISFSLVKSNIVPDSVRIYFDGNNAGSLRNAPWNFSIPGKFASKTGRKALKVVAFKGGMADQTITRFLIVFSDVVPKRNGYMVVNTFPHDREAFTQGLVYDNGFLYEGTGQETRSSLRKVKLETGQVINQLDMGAQFFGEGIAIYRDKIYQLTWQSKVGFVYEKETFRQVNRVYYQSEGWGLTTMGNKFVLSDGTNMLYLTDPDSFSVISTLEVYDNKARVMELNELEFINGEIWANIWQTDLIARIDPMSGKVIAYIDLQGILKDPSTDTKVNVLNGIAWDQAGNRIFVTGKNWPSLFEIKITE